VAIAATAGEVLHSNAWYLARDSLFLAAAVYLLIAVFLVQPGEEIHNEPQESAPGTRAP